MDETYFFRNLENLNDLETKTNRKVANNQIKSKYSIIHTIDLNQEEFKMFCLNFKHNYKFLYEYIEEMRIDKDGIWNCVVIKNGEKRILVQNNGYSYPRFTGLVL